MKSRTSRSWKENLSIRLPQDYPWKVLTHLIEDHRSSLHRNEFSILSQISRSRDFEKYLELSEAWSPQSNPSIGVYTIEHFRARYLTSQILKKYRFPSSNNARREAAKKKFIAAEESCLHYNEVKYHFLHRLSASDELKAYTFAMAFIRKVLGEELPSQEQLTEWSRHGPGANLDTQHGFTSLYDKYSNWPYSCTSDAYWHARCAIMDDERWMGALEEDYRRRYSIEPWEILDWDCFWKRVIKIENHNRITFVPKNSRTDRSIAIEPALNLYLQLGVDGYIRRRLKRWGVDLDSQIKNQTLAGQGSKEWLCEDPYVTLDLAAASDTVSLKLCEQLLPPMWYHYLKDLRSPYGKLEGHDELIKYEKVSSMGNGYTFALESLIFTSLVYGVEKAIRGTYDPEQVAVFGDDIVVRRSSSDLLVRMLNHCGFAVNEEKSFFEGPFRESCGADWFRGAAVRPVYLEELPTIVPALWNDVNRIQRYLWLHGYKFNCRTPSYMDRWIPEKYRKFVGPCSDEDFYSYRHSEEVKYFTRGGLRWFNRLTLQSKPAKRGLSYYAFNMRKLMDPLRAKGDLVLFAPWTSKSWCRVKLTTVGNVFAITDSRAVVCSVTPSQAPDWLGEYTV